MKDTELLNERQVWGLYGLTPAWQRRTRRERRGPSFLKLGKMVRYRKSDIDAYLAANTVGANRRSNRSTNKKARRAPKSPARTQNN